MLQEVIHPVIHPPEQLPIDNVTSPISAQMFDFCDQDLFPEPLQNSDVSSCSNCIYEDNSSYTTTTNISYSSSFPSDVGKFSSNSSSNSNNNNSNNENDINLSTMTNNNNLSIIFDSQDETDNNIAASINFLSQTTFSLPQFISNQEDQFDFSSLQSQIPLTDVKIPLSDIKIPLTDVVNNVNGFSPYSPDQVTPLAPVAPLVPNVFDDDCLSALPASYVNLDPSSPSCSFLDPSVAPFFPGTLNSGLPGDATGIFTGGILMAGSELQPHELDFQGDNGGIYGSDSVQRVYNSSEIQTITDNQQLVNGGGSSNSPLTSEISTLEESSYKVGRLSVEERKEKIHRYMKKRNERNFSKKIKYACRKTLADSRPRVRGRFAKNDDFGEAVRSNGIHHDDEDDEVVGKEEEDMVDSSDIFAHISGVNSFKCNYPLQSWM